MDRSRFGRTHVASLQASRDRSDIGAVEAAYADMARAAGLEVAPTLLLPSKHGDYGYFGTQRFDRGENGLMSIARFVTRGQSDVERAFRPMIFNVIAKNGDDHAKQHAFLMNPAGVWHLTPSYDLTFSAGPGGEHYFAVNGRGTGIGPAVVRAVARRQSIQTATVSTIIDDVRSAVSGFRGVADRYGVSSRSRDEIASVLDRHVADFAARR